jgi:hypothetical protein
MMVSRVESRRPTYVLPHQPYSEQQPPRAQVPQIFPPLAAPQLPSVVWTGPVVVLQPLMHPFAARQWPSVEPQNLPRLAGASFDSYHAPVGRAASAVGAGGVAGRTAVVGAAEAVSPRGGLPPQDIALLVGSDDVGVGGDVGHAGGAFAVLALETVVPGVGRTAGGRDPLEVDIGEGQGREGQEGQECARRRHSDCIKT